MPYADDGGGIAWTKGAIAAAVVVATIVLLAAYALWPDNGGDDSTATGSTTTVAPPGPTVGDGEAEPPPDPAVECPSDRQNSTEIPPPIDGTVTWDIYNGAVVPRSSTAGPLRIEDSGLAHCYEQSPSGAVIAAMNFTLRVAVSPERLSIIAAQAVDNPGRDAVLGSLAEFDGQVGAAECPVAAYQVRSFSPTVATIGVASKCGANDIRETEVRVVWVTDDWQISYPSTIGADVPPSRLQSLDGWTKFQGVGS